MSIGPEPESRKPPAKAKANKSGDKDGAKSGPPTATFGRTIRETIESVVIAFILAFMFRTFEAEAFVIPTGSMANTLKGRHKDLLCPQCDFRFQVSASEEVDEDGNRRMVQRERRNALGEIEKWLEIDPNATVASGTCPNCRFTVDDADTQTSYSGDRILVAKFPFEFFANALDEPRRWEVIVFKYPINAKQNYIKRLVGLPGEMLKIHHGDVFISHDGGQAYKIARKPPHKVLAMMQTVYNNENHSAKLDAAGWPQRWQVEPLADSVKVGEWKTDDGSLSFHTPGAAGVQAWLRYRHFVPSFEVWNQIDHGGLPKDKDPPQPQLITDMYAYNTPQSQGQAQRIGGIHAPDPDSLGLHWVGDLVVECDLTVEQASGTAVLELIKGGRRFQCRLNLEKNQAELSIDGGSVMFTDDQGQTAAKRTATPPKLAGAGTYHLTYANVDEQLYLWINGTPVEFDGPATFDGLVDDKPTAADLSPVGIASEGAGLKVGGLKLWRDVYYIAAKRTLTADYNRGPLRDRPIGHKLAGSDSEQFISSTNLRAAFLSNPRGHFGTYDWNWEEDFADLKTVEFTLRKDPDDAAEAQFFMMGDNSPSSSDSRLWKNESTGQYVHYVPRHLLVGKALFIYWPHSFDKIPGTGIPFPFFPNFARMGFVK